MPSKLLLWKHNTILSILGNVQQNKSEGMGEHVGGGEHLEPWSKWPDTCETRGKFFLQRGDNINNSVQIYVIRCTSCNTGKMHKLTSSQLSSQAQLYLEGSNV